MAVRIALPSLGFGPRASLARRVLVLSLAALLLLFVIFLSVFGYEYHKYGVVVEQRLERPLFTNTAKIYAAARQVRPGQKLTAATVEAQLRTAGYSEGAGSQLGSFDANGDAVTIRPGPQSFHAPEAATITFDGGKVQGITAANGDQLASYALEPLLITGLSDANRTKRSLITYNELPPMLISAVTSIEDRRFFSHGGVDYIRIGGALRNDLLHRHSYTEGGSTLTMQLARGFFLTPAKHIKRKLLEIMITWNLESRLSKQRIFELYANQIPLGQAGSFSINGFGEAAQAYFGKDVSKLNLQECALLAGMIQSPSRLNPLHHAVRAVERRNLVLDQMAETGATTKDQAEQAKAAPLKLAPISVRQDQAPYFVDLVRDQINARLNDPNWNEEGLRIYTSLDPQLQAAAAAAVDTGMARVDALVEKRHAKLKLTDPVVYPQVALIALDPHTGQVLALVGGRNYGESQYDHATAHRPTASTFKPFVYAAAFNSALAGTQLTNQDGTAAIFTPTMLLPSQQQDFDFNGGTYSPRNFHRGDLPDQITAQTALKLSLNPATVTLAQMVGFGNVAALARDAGIASARATPSVALGAYDATPLEMAGAYTAFANSGVAIKPLMLASVRTANGDPVRDFAPQSHPTLDPRVAYLTTSMMESVLNSGTGFVVRSMGFNAPAAGKTGTEHDSWFIGYTSNLLCVVWIGNDDYSDIKLTGTVAAAPIWAEFMKRAVALPQYSDAREFSVPDGVTVVKLDKATNLLADEACPDDYQAAFLAGTAPVSTCDQQGQDQRNLFQKIFGVGKNNPQAQLQQAQVPAPPAAPPQPLPLPNQAGKTAPGALPGVVSGSEQTQTAPQPAQEKKPGFFGRLFGKRSKQEPAPQP